MNFKTCRQCGLKYLIGIDGLCPSCIKLKEDPDQTSKRSKLMGVPFEDLKQVDETDRFKLIAEKLISNPGVKIGLMVEVGGDYKGKGDRYIAAVRALVPNVQITSRSPGPVKKTETIIFTLPKEQA